MTARTPKGRRRFGGLLFRRVGTWKSKRQAQTVARNQRQLLGNRARITRTKAGWSVYARR